TNPWRGERVLPRRWPPRRSVRGDAPGRLATGRWPRREGTIRLPRWTLPFRWRVRRALATTVPPGRDDNFGRPVFWGGQGRPAAGVRRAGLGGVAPDGHRPGRSGPLWLWPLAGSRRRGAVGERDGRRAVPRGLRDRGRQHP